MRATIREFITPRQRKMLNLVARACNELIIDVVPCWCGAVEGEYCRHSDGSPGEGGSPHADRRTAAQSWKRQNPKEWERLKEYTFRRLCKELDRSTA